VARQETLPVTVVIPTIGRPAFMREVLEALSRSTSRPAEVVVVDQSNGSAVEGVVAEFADLGVRVERCALRGHARARNRGLRAARQPCVLFIDDDCLPAADWVSTGYGLAQRDPGCLWTGRVLPQGDPQAVPSTKDDPNPREFTGTVICEELYTNNMVLPRQAAFALGGFDETIVPAAEDCDFCYRWLRAGHPFRYEPTLVVHHREWRTPEELIVLYRGYARGQGVFYGKHLRRGDLTVLRFAARDIYGWIRAMGAAVLYRRPRWSDPRRGVIYGLLPGIVAGWMSASRASP
jgi:GT2 family glycosyltransferase